MPKVIARNLSVGMSIKNVHPIPEQDTDITLTNTMFVAGKSPELDQIAFECKYGWSYLYCSQEVELAANHRIAN